MTRGVSISYGDVAIGAKENFAPEATGIADFVKLKELNRYNVEYKNYANPCELYQTLLDGKQLVLPNNYKALDMGVWSAEVSGDDGTFAEPIVLTLKANALYSSQGLTLTFDKDNDVFATDLNIKWYRNSELLSDVDFTPTTAQFFCRNQVTNYNEVQISIKAINVPKNRLKLRSIDYGYGTVFYGDELKSVHIIQEIDPISSEVFIGTCDFTIYSKGDIIYSFQNKQPVSVYFNGELKATTFVSTSARKGLKVWDVQCEDYIGALDDATFFGGIYYGYSASELLDKIFAKAKVPYNVTFDISGLTVSGYLPIDSCRASLMQVLFAIGAVALTEGRDVVEIAKISHNVSQTIGKERIKIGQSFNYETNVTAVEITAHSYSVSEEETTAYEGEAGTDIMVKFSQPLHSLSITNGTIKESNANYAIIDAGEECILTGKQYTHNTVVKSRKNEILNAQDVDNVRSVTDATLVNYSNADRILDNYYEWLLKTQDVNVDVIEKRHVTEILGAVFGEAVCGTVKYAQEADIIIETDAPVSVGDKITTQTEYLGDITGRIVKSDYTLNGVSLVKRVVMR